MQTWKPRDPASRAGRPPRERSSTVPIVVRGISYIGRVAETAEDEESYAVYFMPSSGGVIPPDRNVIVDWIDEVLADPDYRDTTAKLLSIENVVERHVFIMSGYRTSFGVDHRLQRVTAALPDRQPGTPPGITHLWLASRWADPEYGSFAAQWSPSGWRVFPIPEA